VRHNALQNDGNEIGQNTVQNSGIQIVKNMNGLSVVLKIANKYGNGNVETTLDEGNGNGNGINVQNSSIQIVKNMNGLSVVLKIANQYGNGNVETTLDEGNGNGINGNLIRCYNCRGEGHYASNCTVKPRKRDAAYL
nr:hypothetical protein [Tanacetum cinerariifolium]